MQRYFRLSILSILSLMIFVSLKAQENLLVQARVVDGLTLEPLIGVNVVWDGGDAAKIEGTSTDVDGTFQISVPPTATLQFSYVGYESMALTAAEVQEKEEIRMTTGSVILSHPIVRAKINYDELYTATVQRLNQSELWINDAINISQAFDGLPGVQVQQGALNTQRLSIRGIGARTPFATDQVRLYWNDIPLTNGAGESVLEDIESGFLRMAYVQTGPAPSALGANLGGSIQLISKEWDIPNWGTSLGISVGDFGRNREWLNLHNEAGKWQQDLSLVRSQSAGYRENNEYERFSGTALGRIQHTGGETIYMLHARQLQAEIPSSLNAVDFVEKPTAAAFNWASVNGREDQLTYLAGLQHSRRIAYIGYGWGDLSNRSSVFGGKRTNDEVRPFNIINESSYQYGLRTNFRLANAKKIRGSLQLGAELFLENYEQTTFRVLDGGEQGDELGNQTENRFYYFAFTQWTANWGKAWKTVLDLNLRQTQFNWQAVNLDEDFIFDPLLLPGVSVFYKPSKQQLRFHARYNRGISQPDAAASIENSFLNGEPLRPAFGWNKEVGVHFFPAGFSLKLTAFQMDLEDALVQRQNNSGMVLFFNGGSARHQGLEVQIQNSWYWEHNELSFQSNYTLADYRFKDFVDNNDDFSGNAIPGVPKHRLRNSLSWKKNRLSGSLSLDIADQQWVDDENTTTAEGYAVVHTKWAYAFPSLGRGLDVYLGCNNILDRAYASMVQVNASGFGGNLPRYFYPALPRYIYFGINYGL